MQQLFHNNSFMMLDRAGHTRTWMKIFPASHKQMSSRYFKKIFAPAYHMYSDVSARAKGPDTVLPVEDFVRSRLLPAIVRSTTETWMGQDTGTGIDGYLNELRSLFVGFAGGSLSPLITKVSAEAKSDMEFMYCEILSRVTLTYFARRWSFLRAQWGKAIVFIETSVMDSYTYHYFTHDMILGNIVAFPVHPNAALTISNTFCDIWKSLVRRNNLEKLTVGALISYCIVWPL